MAIRSLARLATSLSAALSTVLTAVAVTGQAAVAQSPAPQTTYYRAVGRIEAVAASPCGGTATHRIACSEVHLQSTAVNLANYEGQVVEIVGAVIDPGCVLADGLLVQPAAGQSAFDHTGWAVGPRIGTSVTLETSTQPGTLLVYSYSTSRGVTYAPTFGVLLLGGQGLAFNIATQWSSGNNLFTAPIPSQPALIGTEVVAQVIAVGIDPLLNLPILNPDCFTIQP